MEDFEILQIINSFVIKPFTNDVLLVLSFDCDIETDYNSNKSNIIIINNSGAVIRLLKSISKPEYISYGFINKNDDNIKFIKYHSNSEINESNDTLYIYINENNEIEILDKEKQEHNEQNDTIINVEQHDINNDINDNDDKTNDVKENILFRILKYIKNLSIKTLDYIKRLYYKFVHKISKKQKIDECISRIEMDTVV